MATKSFTTEFKFDGKKDANKLMDAIESSKFVEIDHSQRKEDITNKEEIASIFSSFHGDKR